MLSVRIGLRAARDLLEFAEEEFAEVPGNPIHALAELRQAIAKASRASTTRRIARKPKEAKHKAKREATSEVRALVAKRVDGRCEACGESFGLCGFPEMDHFFGRGRAESVETCWLLCRTCHREKTNNWPTAAYWLRAFAAWSKRHGYTEAEARACKRLAFVEARGAP